MISKTPIPPYYAVIFTSKMSKDTVGYSKMAEKMLELAKEQDGFLGVESAREDLGITVSYWRDEEAIKNWKSNSTHKIAQEKGKEKWYSRYKVRIAKVERDYEL